MRRTLAILLLLISTAASGEQPMAGSAMTQQILSTTTTAAGQPILLPSGPVRVVATRYEIPPGVALPVHRHPYPRYAYVLAGDLSVTDQESRQQTTYRTGDVIVEMVDRWHSGRNVGSVPVVLLVIDQVPEQDASNTQLRQ